MVSVPFLQRILRFEHCLIVLGRDDKLKRITETHVSYDPLQYPLLFPYSSPGYQIYMKQSDGKRSLSSMQFYNFRLMIRDSNYLLLHCDLLNQYIVDMYAKIEGERLLFCQMNQKKLRSEQYCHLKDSLIITDSTENIGDLVIHIAILLYWQSKVHARKYAGWYELCS